MIYNTNPNNSRYNTNDQIVNGGSIDRSFYSNGNKAETIAINQATEGAEALKSSTIDSSISNIGTRSDLKIQETGLKYERNINTLTGFLSSIDQLLQEIENIKSGISKKGKDKATKNAIKSSESALNAYAKQLKDKKKTLLKQKGSITIYDGDIKNLQEIRGKVEKIKEQLATRGQRNEQRVPEQPYNSLGNAKKSNKRQIDMIRFNQQYQEEVRQGAISRIFNGNIQDASDFYRRIAEGQYTQADYELYIRNTGTLTPSLQKCGISTPLLMPSTGGVHIEQGNTPSNYSNLDWGETFQQGGIAGCLDKVLSNFNNLTPGQRNTRKNLGVLGGVAAGIFGLYKFYTNKNMGFWKKAGITAAAIFGSQALTGEGPVSLFNKLLTGGFSRNYMESTFGNMFGNAVNGLGNSGIESSNTTTPAMYSMMVFNPNTTIGDVNTMTQQFIQDNPKGSRRTFRSNAIDKLKNKYGTQSSEYFSATFSENFDAEKRNNRLASFGVTDLSSTQQRNTPIYEIANNAATNETIIAKFKTEHGVKETSNKVKKKEFKEYIQHLKETNQAINISVLKQHQNDWFEDDNDATYTERPIDIQFKDTLTNQVETLGINETKKSELKSAIKKFYDERTIDSKPLISDFSLKIENGLLILTSHNGQETKINIDTNEIVDFGKAGTIRFSDLSELLNVADITNSILNSQKGKIATSNPPFQYKSYNPFSSKGIGLGGRGIYFNDETFSSGINFDTRVLSGGRGGVMGRIDTLSDHPHEYAEYLSKRRIEINKPTTATTPATN